MHRFHHWIVTACLLLGCDTTNATSTSAGTASENATLTVDAPDSLYGGDVTLVEVEYEIGCDDDEYESRRTGLLSKVGVNRTDLGYGDTETGVWRTRLQLPEAHCAARFRGLTANDRSVCGGYAVLTVSEGVTTDARIRLSCDRSHPLGEANLIIQTKVDRPTGTGPAIDYTATCFGNSDTFLDNDNTFQNNQIVEGSLEAVEQLVSTSSGNLGTRWQGQLSDLYPGPCELAVHARTMEDVPGCSAVYHFFAGAGTTTYVRGILPCAD